MKILMFLTLSTAVAAIRKYHFIRHTDPSHLGLFKSRNHSSLRLNSLFPEEVASKIATNFDRIRNDEVALEPRDEAQIRKNLYLKAYPTLAKYTRELNSLLRNATFSGCTIVEKKRDLDNAILHFRGAERAENQCLCFSPKYFPLYPSCFSPYRGVTERSLDYFEHVLSGLTGLRVTGVWTPLPFRNVVEIGFADATAMDNVLYKLIVLSDRVNKLLLVDNTDQTVLGTSECLLEEKVKDHSHVVGKKLNIPPPKKEIPRADESFEEFRARFKGMGGTNIFKALMGAYEGLDYLFVVSLCSELGIDPTSYLSHVPDINLFHERFVAKVKSTIDNDGPFEDTIRKIYDAFGTLSPGYRLNRLLETTGELAEKARVKLEASVLASERADDPEKLAMATEKMESVTDYQKAISEIRKSQDPKKLENLEEFHEQLLMIHDPISYKAATKKRKVEKAKDEVVKKRTEKVGKILTVPVNASDDAPLLIVGRNARQNEVVTHELRKRGDLWLHAKDCPGAHVLLRDFEKDDFSVQVAADVASFFSKNRARPSVEVVVAEIERVRKEKHALLGAVLVEEFKTVVGDPERGGKFIADFKGRSE